jgi:hypothetical protein
VNAQHVKKNLLKSISVAIHVQRVYLRTHADMILNEAMLLQEADMHFQQCLDSLQAVHSDATAGSKRAELEKREPTFCSNNRAVGSRNYELPAASLWVNVIRVFLLENSTDYDTDHRAAAEGEAVATCDLLCVSSPFSLASSSVMGAMALTICLSSSS